MHYLRTAVANSYDDGDDDDASDDCSGFRDKPARRRRMQISSRRADPRKISTSSNPARQPQPDSLTQHLCSFSTNSRPTGPVDVDKIPCARHEPEPGSTCDVTVERLLRD